MTQKACSNCGHPLSEYARFCPNCGHDVTEPLGTVEIATPVAPSDTGEPEEDRPNWRALEAVGIYLLSLIATLIIMLPVGFALRPLARCGTDAVCLRHRDVFNALSVGVQEAALLVTILLWIRLIHKRRPRSLGFKGFTSANVLIGIGVGLLGELVALLVSGIQYAIIQGFTHRPVVAPKQLELQSHPSVAALAIVGVSVIGITPFAEEAFFRGFIFRRLSQRYRIAWAIVISGAIFGVLHVYPLIILPIFSLGCLLAAVVNSRKSIVPTIFAHATFNAIGFSLQFLVTRK